MQKKLLAVAVAGVLAAPGVALAQSSVTISGVFKASLEWVSIGSRSAASNGMNNTATRLADDSSRIIFNVTEDLGGGLSAIGQLDIRFRYDEQGQPTSGAATSVNVGGSIGAGNTFVGLKSSSWGQLTFGRNDLHYFNTESTITTKAASLRMDSISLLAYIDGSSVATASRTQNVTRWLSPNWGGFTMIAAYSTNGAGNDNDMSSLMRRGSAWNLNPNFQASNFQVGYSYWNQKSDGVSATTAAVPAGFAINQTTGSIAATPAVAAVTATSGQNQRGDRLYGSFKWSGFQIGLAWDKSQLTNLTQNSAGVSTNLKVANRNAWSIPASYTMGNHNFYAHYTVADDDKTSSGTAGTRAAITNGTVCGPAIGACGTGAKMWALAYVYDLSKRTSMGISWSKINNENGAAYNHFTSTSLGDSSSAVVAGEDPRILAATIRHAF